MQVPGPFDYERATGVEHAVGLLERLGEGARVVAGGHSLLPMMKLRLANPEYLVDINDLAGELGYLEVEPTRVRLGALVRHRQALESEELAAVCPIFRDAERVIADPVVRNRGTVGGSLCQADPAEDLTTVCTVLDATCVIRGPEGTRRIAMRDFLVGPYETALAYNELLLGIEIPRRARTSSAYAKVERRVGDWAIVAAGARVTLARGGTVEDAGIGLTAANPDTAALLAASRELVGEEPTETTIAEVGRRAGAACSPVSDMRGSAEYKRHLATELTMRAVRSAVARARAAGEREGQ
ncbi:FAD binding domain-containing protein [Nocardia alni]|uniref:FAD binding domain-containing protein n=1 Tax=Nocardia alni TaxID=2815723 RepID=UPI001C23CA3C|nr:xanthine dehydrogenase family protein subunit M [Nocardia alni]